MQDDTIRLFVRFITFDLKAFLYPSAFFHSSLDGAKFTFFHKETAILSLWKNLQREGSVHKPQIRFQSESAEVFSGMVRVRVSSILNLTEAL